MFDRSGYSTTEYTATIAECPVYEVVLDGGEILRPLRPAFTQMVAAIDLSDPTSLFNFINSFGTHFPTFMMFGGKSYSYAIIEKSSFYKLESSGIDPASGSQLETLSKLGVNIKDDPGYLNYLNLTSVQSSIVMKGMPAPLPPFPNGNPSDISAWNKLVQLPDGNPQPIRVGLSGIFNLLTPLYFPNDPLIGAKGAAILSYLNNDYCGRVPGCGYLDPSLGALAWFQSDTCPPDWVLHDDAVGRVLLSVMNASAAGIQVGTMLGNLEQPSHYHNFSGSFGLRNENIALAPGNNVQLSHSGLFPFSGSTNSSTPDFTYIQLALCRFAPNGSSYANVTFPQNSVMYFDSSTVDSCPPTWIPYDYPGVDGRVLVPSNQPGILPSKDNPVILGQPFSHTHSWTLSWSPDTTNVLADNSNGGDAANTDTVITQGSTDSGSVNVPYLSALTCLYEDAPTKTGIGIPPGMLFFTQDFKCPSGWQPISGTYVGHYLVAVSPSGDAPQSVGMHPISPGNTSYIMDHVHEVNAFFQAPGAFYEGTLANDHSWASSNGKWTDTTLSYSTSGGVPFVQMLMCRQA